MDLKKKLSSILYFYFGIVFMISCVVTCGILMTINVSLVWPFSKSLYRKLQYYLGYTMFAQSVFMLTWWSSSSLKVYVDKETHEKYLGKEHSLCVLNHSGELDWIIMSGFFGSLNILGNVKAYMKNEVKFIPFVGWGFYCCEFIYLSRSYEKDKEVLKKSAAELGNYDEPISIFLFPEGTRFSVKKYLESLEFSRKRGLPELHHHLVPRTKGFTTSIPYMRDKIKAIYNVEIAFKGTKPTISNMFKANHFNIHMYLDRIPIEDVPEGEQEQDQYLRDMFYMKDKMMDSFKKTGDFFELSGVQKYAPIDVGPQRKILYNFLMWFFFSTISILYGIFKLYLNGHHFYLSLFIGFIAFSFFLLRKTVDEMEVKGAKELSENGDYITKKPE